MAATFPRSSNMGVAVPYAARGNRPCARVASRPTRFFPLVARTDLLCLIQQLSGTVRSSGCAPASSEDQPCKAPVPLCSSR